MRLACLVAFVLGFAALYRDVMLTLVRDWYVDENYSHGFLIIPIAAYLAWERRAWWAATPSRPAVAGLAVVAVSLMLFVTGRLGAERFLMRISLVGVIAGTVWFSSGGRRLRVLAFPIAFLGLMIPLPAIVFNQITFPLQILASKAAAWGLGALHIPVLREGNVIVLATTTLEVAEACSGIRSLMSLLALGIVYGYLADSRRLVRVFLAAVTIPIAIVANALRVGGTGVAAQFLGRDAADGFLHAFSGWLVFAAAVLMLLAVERAIRLWAPEHHRKPSSTLVGLA